VAIFMPGTARSCITSRRAWVAGWSADAAVRRDRGGALQLRAAMPDHPPRLRDVARYRVIFGDCDPMRIMYHANYLRLFEIGRAELFRLLGHPFPTYVAQGLYLAVLEATCRYKQPARYDDEVIIRAGFASVGHARLTIAYEALNLERELLAHGHTAHAVVDDDGRPRRLPPEFRAAALAAL
jgi:acyl-CoA thioester hydrolase